MQIISKLMNFDGRFAVERHGEKQKVDLLIILAGDLVGESAPGWKPELRSVVQ